MPRRSNPPSPSSQFGKNGLRFEDGYPNIEDIARHLRFESTTGSVWLYDQRVVVLQMPIFEALRTTLVESMGLDEARKLLTTLGYDMGQSDATLAKKLRGQNGFQAAIAAGPQLVGLKGMCNVDPLMFKVDFDEGKLLVEAALVGSVEADLHIQNFGVGDIPACWFSAGHASGFFSRYMGKPVLFREVECRAMGNTRCRLVGMPLNEFENPEKDIKYFNVPDFKHIKTNKNSAKRKARRWMYEDKQAPEDLQLNGGMVGASAGFKVAIQMLKKVATTTATVLFIGRSGVGKEFFSQTLHNMSKRADQPFIAVNCAAIPNDLLEAELFGVEKGAYTGATESRKGRFERADGGTLFLDEISSLTLPAQGKLLRALQEGEIERLGGKETITVDVRIVAATNVDLRDEVAAKRFREDLFFRLNVFPIHIPPLRSRREDIPMLMNVFLKKYATAHERSPAGFTEEAVEAMLSYDWPGNIREMENIIERAVILVDDQELIHTNHLFTSGEQLPERMFSVDKEGHLAASSPTDINWEDLAHRVLDSKDEHAVEDFEKALIDVAVKKSHGNVSSAASLLGMTRGQLDYRLKKDLEDDV
jgi:two-component system, NtrC family, response regulator HydG